VYSVRLIYIKEAPASGIAKNAKSPCRHRNESDTRTGCVYIWLIEAGGFTLESFRVPEYPSVCFMHTLLKFSPIENLPHEGEELP